MTIRTRSRIRRKAALAAGLAALVATLAACGDNGTSSTEPTSETAEESVLKVGLFQEIDSMDPAGTGLAMTSVVLMHIYDPLVWYLPNENGDLEFYPGLAESWEISDDATTYTFHLRQDVTFHDGTELTAEAVKATFDHIVDPATQSRSALGSLGAFEEVRVVDEYTAEVVFSQPNSAFLRLVTVPAFGIQSPSALEEYAGDVASHPTGTGPFKFVSYQAQDAVVVEKNEDYAWGPEALDMDGAATFDQIRFEILLDSNARFNALQSGEIDVAMNLAPETISTVLTDDKFEHYDVPSTGIPYGYPLNVSLAPTDELEVRQAILHAVDVKQLNETVLQGAYTPAFNYVTSTTTGYVAANDEMYAYDPDRARELLDEAGWVEGADGMRSRDGQALSLEILIQTDNGFELPTSYVVEALREIGISSSVESQPFSTAMSSYNSGVQNLAAFFFYSPDPDMLRNTLITEQIAGGFNWSHFSDPEMDEAIAAANAIANDDERRAAYEAITTTVMEEALYLPLWNVSGKYSARADLVGIKFNATGYAAFHSASFE